MKPLAFVVIIALILFAAFKAAPYAADRLDYSPAPGVYLVDEATSHGKTIQTELIRLNIMNSKPEGGMRRFKNVPHAKGNYLVIGENGKWEWTNSQNYAFDLYGMNMK